MSCDVRRLSCDPIVVELALPILAHEPSFIFTVVSLLMRSRDRAPLHLELAGPVRQLADADVHAALPQRLPEESHLTAPLSLSLRLLRVGPVDGELLLN